MTCQSREGACPQAGEYSLPASTRRFVAVFEVAANGGVDVENHHTAKAHPAHRIKPCSIADDRAGLQDKGREENGFMKQEQKEDDGEGLFLPEIRNQRQAATRNPRSGQNSQKD